MPKYKLYVSISHKQLYHDPHDGPWEYEVEMQKEYIPIFSKLFNQTSELEFANFWRSHLPYIPYHYDEGNHKIDKRTQKLYALIHEFSNDESKQFIEGLPYFR